MISRNDIMRLAALAVEARRACNQLASDLEAVAADPDVTNPNGAFLAWALEDSMSASYSIGRALSYVKDLEA